MTSRADRIGRAVAHLSLSTNIASSRMPLARRRTAFMVVLIDSTTPNRTGWSQYAAMPSTWPKRKSPRAFHLGQALPAQGPDPSEQEVEHTGSGLIGPQAIELLTQDIGFEEPPICGKQRLEFHAFGA